MSARITATPEATAALTRLATAHGGVILHVTGGAEDAGTPVCLPLGDLLIGPRDVRLGEVDGVGVYEMRSRPEGTYRDAVYELDVREGVPVGFSLSPGEGLRFSLRELPDPVRDHAEVS